jgi:hypothetical protein
MSDAADFVVNTLQREGSWSRAERARRNLGDELDSYGASVGAVRGTIRDALRRYPELTHDEITALSSELWDVPVFERRFAAIVLLQSKVRMLRNTDLTRIEGFLRQTRMLELADPLAIDVVGPVVAGLEGRARERAERVLDRWASDPDPMLRHAAQRARPQAVPSSGEGS